MRLSAQTILRSLSLKVASLLLITIGSGTSAMAQNPRIETAQLSGLAAKATETVDLNLDGGMLQMAANFLSSKDADEAKAKELVNGLKAIYVRSYEFENEGQYSDADFESIRTQLKNPAWTKLVNVKSKKDGGVELYLMQTNGEVTALALLAIEPKEVTFINIIGKIDLEKLTELGGRFGIPQLDVDLPRVKRKN